MTLWAALRCVPPRPGDTKPAIPTTKKIVPMMSRIVFVINPFLSLKTFQLNEGQVRMKEQTSGSGPARQFAKLEIAKCGRGAGPKLLSRFAGADFFFFLFQLVLKFLPLAHQLLLDLHVLFGITFAGGF